MEYSAFLASEATFFVSAYKAFISDKIGGEVYPIPEFTLACLRAEAEKAVTAYRLSQIALLGTVYNPWTRIELAHSCERTQKSEQKIFDILTHFHLKCLEELDDQTFAGKNPDKLRLRWK